MLDEQGLSQKWTAHSQYLKQLLNLKRFALAGKKVKSWIADRGTNFLTTNTGIGTDLASAELLLKSHDKFEASAEVSQPFIVTRSGSCWIQNSAVYTCVHLCVWLHNTYCRWSMYGLLCMCDPLCCRT